MPDSSNNKGIMGEDTTKKYTREELARVRTLQLSGSELEVLIASCGVASAIMGRKSPVLCLLTLGMIPNSASLFKQATDKLMIALDPELHKKVMDEKEEAHSPIIIVPGGRN
jgi:hypothetical protein